MTGGERAREESEPGRPRRTAPRNVSSMPSVSYIRRCIIHALTYDYFLALARVFSPLSFSGSHTIGRKQRVVSVAWPLFLSLLLPAWHTLSPFLCIPISLPHWCGVHFLRGRFRVNRNDRGPRK